MKNKTITNYTCQYCGANVHKYANICSQCCKKRKLIRQIRAMLLQAKKEVEAKRKSESDTK